MLAARRLDDGWEYAAISFSISSLSFDSFSAPIHLFIAEPSGLMKYVVGMPSTLRLRLRDADTLWFDSCIHHDAVALVGASLKVVRTDIRRCLRSHIGI